MENTSGFQSILENRKEKKRRKKRRRRMRRGVFFLLLLGFLAYTGILEDLFNRVSIHDAQDAIETARYMGSRALSALPGIGEWVADKMTYIAQFM